MPKTRVFVSRVLSNVSISRTMFVSMFVTIVFGAFALTTYEFAAINRIESGSQTAAAATTAADTPLLPDAVSKLSPEEQSPIIDKNREPVGSPTPPPVVANAPQADACAAARSAIYNEWAAATAEENQDYTHKQNEISEKYSAEGRAFGQPHKKAQERETVRHEAVLKLLDTNYKRKLAQLNC